MPSRKKKYNARFPAGRIKKIMQSDEEIGKVAKAVPVIISKTLELFVESILRKTLKITNSRNYKTLSPSHLKQCIMAEQKFDFLRELVKNVPDISTAEADGNYQDDDTALTSSDDYQDSDTPSDLSKPSTSNALQQNKSTARNLNLQQNYANGSDKRNSQEVIRRLNNYQNGHGSQVNTNLANNNYDVASAPSTSSTSSMAWKRDAGVLERFQQRIDSKSVTATITSKPFSNATSVIKHTKSLEVSNSIVDTASEEIPNKIARSDSTPGIPFSSFSNESSTLSTATAIATASAIPSSILNYDFSHKAVQLDYSNIGLTAKGISSPSSSGSSGGASTSKSAFDFSQPVISIDLSNLVPPITNNTNNSNNSTNNKKASEVKTPIGAIATISASAAAEMPIATISIGSKSKGGPSSASMLTPKLSSSLDLDEDYDNI